MQLVHLARLRFGWRRPVSGQWLLRRFRWGGGGVVLAGGGKHKQRNKSVHGFAPQVFACRSHFKQQPECKQRSARPAGVKKIVEQFHRRSPPRRGFGARPATCCRASARRRRPTSSCREARRSDAGRVAADLGRSARAGLLTAGRRLLDDCVDLPAHEQDEPGDEEPGQKCDGRRRSSRR